MATARTWTIKGVSERTRAAVDAATRAEGRPVGEWIDRALAKAAAETLHPSPPAATREDVAEVVRELLAPIVTRLDALEGKAGPEEPTGKAAAARAAGGGVGADRGAAPGRALGLRVAACNHRRPCSQSKAFSAHII